jgi:magnesium-protoporphyrin O-methyltransferase
MSNCCSTSSTAGTDKFFSKYSKKYLKRFRKKGLAKEQRLLLEEIGCGVGGLHLTLLQRGAKNALGIDISQGMISYAKQLSSDLGMEGKTTYVHGDFTEKENDIPPTDIVMMDKVVCCYENLDLLLDRSLAKTNNLYAISFPRNYFLVRAMAKSAIKFGKLFHWSFSPYWHDWDRMVQRIRNNGFNEGYRNQTFMWTVCVFQRRQALPLN